MMRFASLSSGSSGNCTFAGTEQTNLLFDAGVSCTSITRLIRQLDLVPQDLTGILITHEHSDHISGLKTLSKKYHVPIYSTQETLAAIAKWDKKKEIDPSLYHPILPDEPFSIGDFQITAFSNSHDAANPVGFRAEAGGKRVAVATDLGVFTDYTVEHLTHLDAVLLESNHDTHMLESGPYPYALKRRIAGAKGHLRNEDAGRLLCELLHDNVRHIFLGHLSEINNFPDLALKAVELEIDSSPIPYRSTDFPISVAPRFELSPVIEF